MENLEEVFDIMHQLYDEQKGCEWVKQQDFRSIAPYTLEEAQEVVEAVSFGTIDDLKDELGDLFFQIIFYSMIGQRLQLFDFNDIVASICKKLKRRNTHIFNEKIAAEYAKSDDKIAFASMCWEEAKQKEKAAKS